MDDRDIPVVHLQDPGQNLRAYVFSGKNKRPLTPTEAKRFRFVQNLKENYSRLKDALSFVEHFAVVCELSQARIEAIRNAKNEALEELSQKFEEKLKAYDQRIQGSGS